MAKQQATRTPSQKVVRIQEFLDMIAPSVVKFNPDHFICGNTYRCVWALREYPTVTEEKAILRHLGEKDGVNLHIYTRLVSPGEERKIIAGAANKNRLSRSNTNDLQQTVVAESNLEDVAGMVAMLHRNREPLLHAAVFLEMIAADLDSLKELQTEVQAELTRSKIHGDRLLLRQKEGFLSVQPWGHNVFHDQFERVLPASSAANFYPMNYSGKTDPWGFLLGRDKCGSNVIVDFNRREEDKTNANILILGNSGQGKSYLMKLILTNLRMAGKSIIILDPEEEYLDLTVNLGGTFVDLLGGKYLINVLEPKLWQEGDGLVIAKHISFLKDFFRSYKDFNDRQMDSLEIILSKLYQQCGIDESRDFSKLRPSDYPVLADLYSLIEKELESYNQSKKELYTKETLQELALALHSICIGADSCFFNGHSNIVDDEFITFGVKGLLQAGGNIKDALLFNVLSFMSQALLVKGNTVVSIDEFYLFLGNLTAVEYIRNFAKRVRKKDSAIILASQNLEDYLLPNIAEYTKPLFAIPSHTFLFNPGNIEATAYMDMLQLEDNEYSLIYHSGRGSCLYKCGNERYNLQVQAPKYKEQLFGKAGGR